MDKLFNFTYGDTKTVCHGYITGDVNMDEGTVICEVDRDSDLGHEVEKLLNKIADEFDRIGTDVDVTDDLGTKSFCKDCYALIHDDVIYIGSKEYISK